jgi:hypothetical protein
VTEQEWKESENIEQMLECVVSEGFPDAEPCNWRRGERKKRLFVCACVSRIWNLLPEEYKAIFEMLEPDLDGLVSDEIRQAKWSAAERISWEHDNLLFAIGYDDIGLLCYIVAGVAAVASTGSSGVPRQTEARQQQEQREQASMLRDIFGNPFRPATLDLGWLTPSVVELARTIYEDRAFNGIPELADALERAGCINADILNHLRRPGPHVRGCWVVDAILGKEWQQVQFGKCLLTTFSSVTKRNKNPAEPPGTAGP